MNTIAAFSSRLAAEQARRKHVRAQRLVDNITALVVGQVIEPTAESVYQVVIDGEKFLLVYDDPSIPEEAA